jgi:aldehyde:ferredoxin oxidoreductase
MDVKYNPDILMNVYWQEIGWDPETGIPTRETLKSLDLLDINDKHNKG